MYGGGRCSIAEVNVGLTFHYYFTMFVCVMKKRVGSLSKCQLILCLTYFSDCKGQVVTTVYYRTVTEFLQIDICTIVLLVLVSAVWWAQTLILSWIPLLQWHNIWPAPREMKLHASWPISTLRRKSSLNRKTKAFVVFACICSVWLFQRKKYGKEE